MHLLAQHPEKNNIIQNNMNSSEKEEQYNEIYHLAALSASSMIKLFTFQHAMKQLSVSPVWFKSYLPYCVHISDCP